MQERALGSSGISVSVVTYGAMGFGGEPVRHEAAMMAALEAGVTAIDTAPLYGFGDSERMVGRVLARLDRRPRVLTKVGLSWDGSHGDVLFETLMNDGERRAVRKDSRPEVVLREIERSRERLELACIDLVQVHHRDPHTPIAETMDALADLASKGCIKGIGVSNYAPDEIREAARALAKRGLSLASLQAERSLLSREADRGTAFAAREVGAGFLCYSPLAQGLLTGAYGPERVVDNEDWRGNTPLFRVVTRKRIAEALRNVAQPIADAHGVTLAQLALAWLLALDGVSAVIAGASTPAQAIENAGAAKVTLTSDEHSRLGAAFAAIPRDEKPTIGERVARRARRVMRRLIGR